MLGVFVTVFLSWGVLGEVPTLLQLGGLVLLLIASLVMCSYNSRINDWSAALEAMATGALRAKPLITHLYPLEQVREAFDMMGGREEFYNKVIITM